MTDMQQEQLAQIVEQNRVCDALREEWEDLKKQAKEAKERLDEGVDALQCLCRGGAKQPRLNFENDDHG
jgi:nitric oxide reductase activation protein